MSLHSNLNSPLLFVIWCGCFSTFLDTVFFVFDNIWIQHSPILPRPVGGETKPYIDQGGPKLWVWNIKNI